MAVARISQLQKQLLRWLATDYRRTQGVVASSHQELVQALQGDKGNISHSLQTLERHGLLIIGRSPGGTQNPFSSHRRVTGEPHSCQEVVIKR
jgi:predicted transcriptional regulator